MSKKKKNIFKKIKEQYEKFLDTRVGNITKNTLTLFSKHDTSTLSAALSYYTIFSIAPMLLIIISLAGLFLGPEAVEGEITKQIGGLVGPESAKTIQDIVKSAYKPGKNIIFTALAIVMLLLGSTGVFGQLRTALNTIWDVKPEAKKPAIKFFINKVFSIAMIGALAFLLLVTLVVQSALSAFTAYLNNHLPDVSVILFKVLDIVISLAVTTTLFAFVYRYMSDARPRWRTVWKGALATTILFGIGKYAIGLYLGSSDFSTTYGASGSIIVLIVWVFYSSQIVFLGAELTRALAIEKGISLDSRAIENDEEVGIDTEAKTVEKKPEPGQPEPKKTKAKTQPKRT